MPHHVRVDGLTNPANQTRGGLLNTYDDWPTTSMAMPGSPEMERLRAFTDAVLVMHQVLTDRFIPMCSCGQPARHCPIVKAEHDVLGMAMPFEFGPLSRPLYYEV